MSVIKSFAVGEGDMFYIEHNSPSFTIIDCCLDNGNEDAILKELSALSGQKEIIRFISTHPDDDHLCGLELLEKKLGGIVNFYCVRNRVTKPDETVSFNKYIQLRDSDKAFFISKGCKRKWMNEESPERAQSGIHILWPNPDNQHFKEALTAAEDDGSPNNISAVIQYSVEKGVTALWMGDLETGLMENVEAELNVPKVDILFAPHHGRESGRIPDSLLTKMVPKIIVVGEAPSEHLHYYPGYDTITQNSAGDVVFECETGKIHVFTSNEYAVDFLLDESRNREGFHYVGTLILDSIA